MKKTIRFFLMIVVVGPLLNFSTALAQSYPEMVTVEGGTFIMGDKLGTGKVDELPAHSVTLNSFSIAKTETTVAEWRTYCTDAGRQMPDSPSWGWHDNDPVVNVNWNDAVAYCKWLSDKTGHLYRLPTEAEYEFAAKGGNNTKGFNYSGSKSLDSSGWYADNSDGHPHTVATKQPNELGLYDMRGNVWEWCNDWYDARYYSISSSSNPQGPVTGSNRVLRGGSWHSTVIDCRASSREYGAPAYHGAGDSGFGFRVASTL